STTVTRTPMAARASALRRASTPSSNRPEMTLQFHLFPTLNSTKVAIALEEMGLAYKVVIVNLMEGGQDDPVFRAINPNGRIPALVDPDAAGGPVQVFESAAILQYLGRRTGQFYPADEQTRARVD